MLFFDFLRNPQIAYFELPILGQEQVDGLQIPMKDFPGVKVLDSKSSLDEKVPYLIFPEVIFRLTS